jgi:hypothetical protein
MVRRIGGIGAFLQSLPLSSQATMPEGIDTVVYTDLMTGVTD